MKFFRKPFFSIFLAGLILFVSCNSDDVRIDEITSQKIEQLDANALKNIHTELKIAFEEANNNSTPSELEEIIEEEYLDNIAYVNSENSLRALFELKGVDTEIIDELKYFIENNNGDDSIYESLITNFNIDSVEEASHLFFMVETFKLVNNGEYSYLINAKRISWGCALAIAGVISVSIFAIMTSPITGGASLAAFIAGKGLAVTALIEACGPGWGDIEF